MRGAQIRKRVRELTILKDDVEKRMARMPKGNLRISNKRKKPQYYHVTQKGDTNGRYIKRSEEALAVALAQKDYYERFLDSVTKEIRALEAYEKRNDIVLPEDVFAQMNEYRRAMVQPIMISDEEYGRKWEKEEFQHNTYKDFDLKYATKRGELVRSKSEVLIADMYYNLGVPYRYECILDLGNGRNRYPDFTIMKFPERRVIYHEHFGMLDHHEYVDAAIKKMSEYAAAGYVLGVDLFVTVESSACPINIKEMEKSVKRFLKL